MLLKEINISEVLICHTDKSSRRTHEKISNCVFQVGFEYYVVNKASSHMLYNDTVTRYWISAY